MSTTTPDAGIPLLTEIIPGPAPVETRPAVPAATEVVKDEVTQLEERATSILEEEEWDRLEREIRERVLYQIIERVDFVLEQRVRDSLADVLQTAVEGLAEEIRGGLHVSMRDVVTRAVTHEITKLKSAKK
ncbi:hypothetical protein [Noviherbaspirillum denitrificans]|uniref:Uncharacterized protein n=1 Tax=Noviherbaspirillum denitrificans TaxID=1968433 RepID=A0A254TBI1_9BURK|nr:hypothetical protein [Noviherbaspirillum denitrificans]OWW20001.1 hypothetical protein AYR66_11315 [Noviherbaspirillum denitrificans]